MFTLELSILPTSSATILPTYYNYINYHLQADWNGHNYFAGIDLWFGHHLLEY